LPIAIVPTENCATCTFIVAPSDNCPAVCTFLCQILLLPSTHITLR
jgi:hypothetical protein